MRISQKNKNTARIVAIAASIAVAVLVAFTIYAIHNAVSPSATEQAETTEPADTGIKEEQVPNVDTEPTPIESENRESKDLLPGNTENTSTSGLLTKPSIARAEKYDSTIEVVATFSSTATGQCELTLSRPGSTDIIERSPITVGPSYYLCGFTVENITSTGWTAAVKHVNGSQQSETVSQKVK